MAIGVHGSRLMRVMVEGRRRKDEERGKTEDCTKMNKNLAVFEIYCNFAVDLE